MADEIICISLAVSYLAGCVLSYLCYRISDRFEDALDRLEKSETLFWSLLWPLVLPLSVLIYLVSMVIQSGKSVSRFFVRVSK